MTLPTVSHGTFAPACTKPDFMPTVIDKMANGMMVLDVCKEMGVTYSQLLTYVHADPGRDKDFSSAVKQGESWQIIRLAQELNSIGLHDLGGVLNEDGTVKPMSEIPESLRRCIASIEVAETFEMVDGNRVWTGYIKTVKLIDKIKAIDLLYKKLKVFVDEIHVSGTVKVEHSVQRFDLDDRLAQLRAGKPQAVVAASIQEAEVMTRGNDI
jgi:hypothetical protein